MEIKYNNSSQLEKLLVGINFNELRFLKDL